MDNFSSALTFFFFSITFLLTLFIIGNAWLILLGPRHTDLPLDLRIPLAMGLGLSFIPIGLLWTTTLGLKLSLTTILVFWGLAGAINLLALISKYPRFWERPFLFGKLWQNPGYKSLAWLAAIFFLTWLTRFIAVHGFLVAPGADSYHHTLISALIAQQGQIPTSYEPYAPPTPFTYHFGFHAVTAFMYGLTGIPLPKLVLWIGQGLNAFIVLSTYFFTKRLTHNDVTALIASFLVGLVSVFPAYLVNWSRFTQLSGLVILILAVGIVLGEHTHPFKRVLPMLVGGIFLFHYRIFAMMGDLIGAILIIETLAILTSRCRGLANLKQLFILLLITGTGLVIVSPWVIRLWLLSPLFTMADQITRTATQSDNLKSFYDLNRLDTAWEFYSNYWLILLTLIGFIRGLIHYKKITLILGIWVGLLLLWSNPYWFPLPGAGLLDINSVIMSLFGPICFFAAIGITQLVVEIPKHPFILSLTRNAWGWKLILIGFTVYTTFQMMTIADPNNVYVRATDLKAMDWINTHTKPDARFLINPYIYERSIASITGYDAGYWIPLLTQRQTTILPMVVPSERIGHDILTRQTTLSQIAINPDMSALATLKEEKITHVFIGERGGFIPVDVLEHSRCVTEVWHQGATKLFELNYDCLPR